LAKKERLDTYLVKLGKFDSTERAKAAILEGRILVNGECVDKAGTLIAPSTEVSVKEKDEEFVSRGGIKLKRALEVFRIDVKDAVVLDVGASTGGFTDCLLKKGASFVMAVDVGYGQLAWPLRNDPKVLVLERTNIRHLTSDKLPILADLVVIDISFISVKKVIDNIKRLASSDAKYLILIKPQFEVDKKYVEKKGIVRNPKTHSKVLMDVWRDFEERCFKVEGLTFSPILGAKGNMEFFFYLRAGKEKIKDDSFVAKIDELVSSAHNALLRD